MIRITAKPAEPPVVLASEGVEAHDALCAAYDGGKRDFPSKEFHPRIYAHEEVKQALIAAQHGKCAFCESYVFEEGEVEHYRPKAAVKQSRRTNLLRPGYYWLAYDWGNLLLSCSACNSARNKGNLFPLADPTRRARCHSDSLADEEPLLINPANADPADHLVFEADTVRTRDRVGAETVAVLRLNERPVLIINRREYYNELQLLCDILDAIENDAEHRKSPQGRKIIREARKPEPGSSRRQRNLQNSQ